MPWYLGECVILTQSEAIEKIKPQSKHFNQANFFSSVSEKIEKLNEKLSIFCGFD